MVKKEFIQSVLKYMYLKSFAYFLYAIMFIGIPWLGCCVLSFFGVLHIPLVLLQFKWFGLAFLLTNALFTFKWVAMPSKFYEMLITYLAMAVTIVISAFIFDGMFTALSYQPIFKQIAMSNAEMIDISYRVDVLSAIFVIMFRNFAPVILHLHRRKKRSVCEARNSF